jgi:hypothetical protein
MVLQSRGVTCREILASRAPSSIFYRNFRGSAGRGTDTFIFSIATSRTVSCPVHLHIYRILFLGSAGYRAPCKAGVSVCCRLLTVSHGHQHVNSGYRAPTPRTTATRRCINVVVDMILVICWGPIFSVNQNLCSSNFTYILIVKVIRVSTYILICLCQSIVYFIFFYPVM